MRQQSLVKRFSWWIWVKDTWEIFFGIILISFLEDWNYYKITLTTLKESTHKKMHGLQKEKKYWCSCEHSSHGGCPVHGTSVGPQRQEAANSQRAAVGHMPSHSTHSLTQQICIEGLQCAREELWRRHTQSLPLRCWGSAGVGEREGAVETP